VGIANTYSGFNNCHRHFPELLDAVKRGVLMAGGLPLEFPTISLGEVFLKPTSLKFRNLMAMDTEEMIRAQPIDAVVLMGGCDKTAPAQLMAAVSANVPTVQLVAGPMSTGRHHRAREGTPEIGGEVRVAVIGQASGNAAAGLGLFNHRAISESQVQD
jgi:dihydroxy-acid dehydratase